MFFRDDCKEHSINAKAHYVIILFFKTKEEKKKMASRSFLPMLIVGISIVFKNISRPATKPHPGKSPR